MPGLYLYRRGNGNQGNFPRAVVKLDATDNAYAALFALVVNDYISGKRVRRHISVNIVIDGERNHPYATVHLGPRGETAGEAWLTAELEPVSVETAETNYYTMPPRPLVELLDRGARQHYRNRCRAS